MTAARLLRVCTVGAGVVSTLLFFVVGAGLRLQTYGDGSIFSYAVATQESWSFHWRNIPTRLAAYVWAMAPGEATVALTGSPQAGVFVYGLLFFAAPAVSLAATYALDRAPGRPYFVWACAANALLAPVVFGFPTEMWIGHAFFWPAFACAMTMRISAASSALLALLTIGFVFSHEGGLVWAFGLVAATALRGWRDARFLRALGCFVLALALWLTINRALQPDAYFGEVRFRTASEFFETKVFTSPILMLICAALAGYALLWAACARIGMRRLPLIAAVAVAVALLAWWTGFDRALHADHRYYLRTILLVGTCAFAGVAGLMQLAHEDSLVARIAPLVRILDGLRSDNVARFVIGAGALVMIIHAVEAVKFVRGFSAYRDAVRTLATGEAADPQLGAPFFVSSKRIGDELNRLSWFSTTPYLSALVSNFRPKRLVIDPAGNYFWLSCATATRAAEAVRAVPQETREMIRVYSCLHRP